MIGVTNPYVIGGIAGACLLSFGAGWMTHSWKADSDRLAKLERGIEKAAEASGKLEQDNEANRTIYREITKQVDKIVDRPVYRDQCFDADGLFLAQSALAGKLSGALPDASAIAGRDGGRSASPNRDGQPDVLRVSE